MKHLPTFVIVLLWPFLSWSQVNPTGQVHGRVLDADTRLPLFGASVALILARDSSMSSFSALSNESGGFWISGVATDRYRLYISYLGYQPLLVPKVIDVDGKSIELGDILLEKKELVLKQVEIIQNKPPIIFRKDTVEYNADYFKTRETSPLESLLKKLPGLQVLADGSLKYNGRVIKSILIDGRPFFGRDIKLATTNLLSGIVDRIQIIEVPEELINDETIPNGPRQQVLNIVLKTESHNKILGILNGGYGVDSKFSIRTNINSFEKNKQFSAIASGNNINEFNDNNFSPNSLMRTWKGGLNYNRDLGKKLTLESSYSIDQIKSELSNSTMRTNFQTDSITNYSLKSSSTDYITVHALNNTVKFRPDSFTTLALENITNISNTTNVFTSGYNTYSNLTTINDGNSKNNLSEIKFFTSSSGNFIRKFNKSRSLINVLFNYSVMKSKSSSFNYSETSYLLSDHARKLDTINLYNNKNILTRTFSFKVLYTKRITSSIFWDISGRHEEGRNRYTKEVLGLNHFNKEFEILNDSLSGNLTGNIKTTSGQISLRKENPKYSLAIGINLSTLNQTIEESSRDLLYKKGTTIIYPHLNVTYIPSSGKSLSLNYDQSLQSPSNDQIFPIPDNTNPVYLSKGNLQLKPSQSTQININYQGISQKTLKSLFINLSTTIYKNRIISNSNYDTIGRQINTFMNINGASTTTLAFFYSQPLLSKNGLFGFNSILGYGRNFNGINGNLYQIREFTFTNSLSYQYTYKNILELSSSLSVNFNRLKYSMFSNSTTNTIDYDILVNSKIKLPLSFEINPFIKCQILTGRTSGFNSSRYILNFSLSKSIFPDRTMEIKGQVFDLLRMNSIVTRNIGPGYIEDISTSSLKRFVMLSCIYYIK